MPKKVSKFTNALKQLGDIQVNDWDFMGLLNKDISEIEIGRSLRRLGNVRVMEWNFRSVLHAERDPMARETATQVENRLSPDEMQELMVRLKDFLQYVAVSLIDEPAHAQIKVREIAPNVLRFKLVLVQRDVSALIGLGGHTAAAIRSLLKAAAGMHGVHALLEILSHEEEMRHVFDPRDGEQD